MKRVLALQPNHCVIHAHALTGLPVRVVVFIFLGADIGEVNIDVFRGKNCVKLLDVVSEQIVMRICFPVDLIAPLADGWPKPSVQTIFDSVGVFENGGGLDNNAGFSALSPGV